MRTQELKFLSQTQKHCQIINRLIGCSFTRKFPAKKKSDD